MSEAGGSRVMSEAMTARTDSKAPRPRNAADTKKRILDAAEAEFAAKGFDGTRLGNIARTAGVQQALIHHYFDDKSGLYRETVDRALGAMSTEGWDILARTVSAVGKSSRSKPAQKLDKKNVRPLVEAFIELLQRFFTEHGHILAIVRHEASSGSELARDIVRTRVKPVVDAITAYLDALKGSGDVRGDVDVRQLAIAAMGMVAFPLMEHGLTRWVWPIEPRDKSFLDGARAEIVETLLARMLP